MSEDNNNFLRVRHSSIPYISFDEKFITDNVLKRLYNEAKRAILCLEIYELLKNLCESQGKRDEGNPGLIITEKVQKQYQQLHKVSVEIAKKIKGRVTITLPDGHVVIDTCKEGNTYDNYVDDIIGENHNSRIAIIETQYRPEGVSHERKFSSTTFQKEIYIAVRLGPFRNSAGTIRLSIPDY